MEKDWYTRKEVAAKLEISLGTVYHWAKQGKLVKIYDPLNNVREARYRKEEVEALFDNKIDNQPEGIRPSTLANQLKVPVAKIYNLIREKELPVDDFAIGDERRGISIPEELVAVIQKEVEKNLSKRGTSTEFFNYQYDIALFQRFTTRNGQDIRVMRNNKLEWGFYHQSRAWIPYLDGLSEHKYEQAYEIHHDNITVKGYVDFILPKDLNESFDFLDFAYENWGVENVRVRELDEHIELSIKSGTHQLTTQRPESLTEPIIEKFTQAGHVNIREQQWELESGTRSLMLEIPEDLMKLVRKAAKKGNVSMSAYIESVLDDKLR